MIKILLIEKDEKYCQKLVNYLNTQNNTFKIISIINDINEIPYFLLKYNIDIIIADLNFNEYKKLENDYLKIENKYKKSVILISNKKVTFSSDYIYECILKTENVNKILEILNALINEKKGSITDKSNESIIKERIKNELLYLGYNLSHSGTKYLIETIYILYTSENYHNGNLEGVIYPLVGKKFGKSSLDIKCTIRYATNIMSVECSENKLINYLYKDYFSNPGPKKIISTVLEKINLDEPAV